jgi:hypothetical protein
MYIPGSATLMIHWHTIPTIPPLDVCQAVPVRCEICSLTVSCQKTYETHISGKAHKKRIVQASHVLKIRLDIPEKKMFSFVCVLFKRDKKVPVDPGLKKS